MTPEERFERIEKTLDRIATALAAKEEKATLAAFASDMRMTKIERAQEFLTESHKQIDESLAKLTAGLTTLSANVDRLETNMEALLNFMSGSAQRQELMVERMSNSLQNLIRLFEDHARDGHGGNGGAQ